MKTVLKRIVKIWVNFIIQILMELYVEICDCKMLLRSRKEVEPKTPFELLTFIISYGEDVFPNLRVALQILLTISVSITICEGSFSKLKLIFTYLRSTMGQDRLSDLVFLSVEREKFEMIDFDEVIDKFPSSKARKMYIYVIFDNSNCAPDCNEANFTCMTRNEVRYTI